MANVLNWLDEPIDPDTGARRATDGGAYVACFSKDADSLSQWRGYAGGRGYCLGFDSYAMSMGMWAHITGRYVAEVLALQRNERVPPEIEADWRVKMEYARPKISAVHYGQDAASTLFAALAPEIVCPRRPVERIHLCHAALSLVKQQAYEVEHEIRAVILQDVVPLDVEFRDGGRLGLVPYVVVSHIPFAFRFPRALHEIVVGPGEDISLRQRAVEQLLRHRGLDGVGVTESGIIFRG